ncbi:MAG: hypothetical protein AAB465_02030 [Patescibacteria group bacterium]
MKKLLLPALLLIVLVLVGCSMLVKNNTQSTQQSKNQTTEITRKAELELESFINDYFYRRQIKDFFLFGDFNAYGSVLAKSIVVYVYPKSTLLQGRAEDIKEMIKKDLQEQLFDFPGFEWTKDYSFDVIVR